MSEWLINTHKYTKIGNISLTKYGKVVYIVNISEPEVIEGVVFGKESPEVTTLKGPFVGVKGGDPIAEKDPDLCKFKDCTFGAGRNGYCLRHGEPK